MKRILFVTCLVVAAFCGLGQSAGEEVEDFLIIDPYGGESFDPCADYSLIPSSGGEPFAACDPGTVKQDFSEMDAKWEEARRSLKGASPDTIISYDGGTGEFTITERDPSDYDLTPIEPSMPDEALIGNDHVAPHTVFDPDTIAIQEIIKEYQRQKTNQRSRKGGSARKPQQYHAEAEVII